MSPSPTWSSTPRRWAWASGRAPAPAPALKATGDLGPLPVDPALLRPGQVVVDLIYHPTITPLLAAAGAQGATTVNGLGMLVHQAAHAFRRWTGESPPIEAMREAAVVELARRA